MGRSVESYIGYGFWVDADGTPGEIDGYIDVYDGDRQLPELLNVDFTGCGDCLSPVIVVKSTMSWAINGRPKAFHPLDLTGSLLSKEIMALNEAHAHIKSLLKDNDWAKVGEPGWILWGSYG